MVQQIMFKICLFLGLHGSKLIIQYNKTSESCVTYADIEIVETSTDFTDLNHTLVWCEGKHLCEVNTLLT
jgi:hypothetical protein